MPRLHAKGFRVIQGGGGEPVADAPAGYVDIFSDRNTNSLPIITGDGTDVIWPAEFNKEMAMDWRAANKLLPNTV